MELAQETSQEYPGVGETVLKYLIKRLLLLIPLMLGITLITFTVIHVAPGEPVEMQMAMNPKVGKETRDRLKKFYGLDRPLHIQYLDWVGKLARLDLGRSFSPDNRLVVDKIKESLKITIPLNIIALLLCHRPKAIVQIYLCVIYRDDNRKHDIH